MGVDAIFFSYLPVFNKAVLCFLCPYKRVFSFYSSDDIYSKNKTYSITKKYSLLVAAFNKRLKKL